MTSDGDMVQLESYDNALALVERESFGEAVAQLTSILREHPRHANAWNLLGYSQRHLGNFDAAEKAYANALSITPGHLGALNYSGQMYIQTGRIDEARVALEQLKVACDGACEEYRQLERAIRDGVVGKY